MWSKSELRNTNEKKLYLNQRSQFTKKSHENYSIANTASFTVYKQKKKVLNKLTE